MPEKYKVYIIAGEESGDLIGESLIKQLREMSDQPLEFRGVGGGHMIGAGLNSVANIDELSCVGIFEILRHLPRLLGLANNIVRDIRSYDPDIVIAIDAQEFSRYILSRIGGKKRVLYVAPSAWAWRPWRARSIKKYVDHLLVLFPFEVEFFSRFGTAVHYIGHPLLENKEILGADGDRFVAMYGIENDVLLLLPGSRTGEIRNLLPVFVPAAAELRKRHGFDVVLCTTEKKLALVQSILGEYGFKCLVTTQGRYDAFKSAKLAIAASGTVLFELGLVGTRAIACYRGNWLSAIVAWFLIRTQFIGLVNILMNRNVMPELLQWRCSTSQIIHEAERILVSDDVVSDLQKFQELVTPSPGYSPSFEAARVVYGILKS